VTDRLQIRNGRVYDPAEGVDGEVRTIFVEDGRVVAGFPEGETGRVIDAAGCVVMPGGVDIHCHIAGSAVNRARRLLPEQAAADPVPAAGRFRGGSGGCVPSTFVTGYRYAGLGYTTAIEAAVAPSSSRQAHMELADTPNIDRGLLLLLANNRMLLEAISRGETALAGDLARLLVRKTGAFGMKCVNPGGAAHWMHGGDPASIATLDDEVVAAGVSPRRILETLVDAAADLSHPLHIHANRLGMPGNVGITLETLDAVAGRRAHLTHAQFHAYAVDGKGGFASGAAALMERFNARPGTTLDVGQVMFGPAVTMTEDSAVEYLLWQLTGRRWVNIDVETQAGCGMVPFEYQNKNHMHCLQWAIGLEIFLLAADPWRVALSTDHPNGGSFLTYPRLIATLMDRDFRAAEIKRADAGAVAKTQLADLNREFTLGEIAIITRAGPARMLGLRHKGRLGVGADADITVYDDDRDRERMFRSPKYVIKGGRVVVEEGHLRDAAAGATFRSEPGVDPAAERPFAEAWDRLASHGPEHLGPPPQRNAEVGRQSDESRGRTP
jgi:formylmethanofuran dehydrogenase subunit A